MKLLNHFSLSMILVIIAVISITILSCYDKQLGMFGRAMFAWWGVILPVAGCIALGDK